MGRFPGRRTASVQRRAGPLGAQRLDREAASCPAKVHRPPPDEALLPAPNAGLRLGRSPHISAVPTTGGEQHDFGPPDCFWGELRS